MLTMSLARATTPDIDPDSAFNAQVARCTGSHWRAGHAQKSSFRACFIGDKMVLLEERVGQPHKEISMRYFYGDGVLIGYRGVRSAGKTGAGSAALSDTVPVLIDWETTGQPRRAVRLEHYGEVRLTAMEIQAIRLRGQQLAQLALTPVAP